MEPILTVSGLTKTYGGNDTRTNALRGLDLKIFPGEFVGVMGPSGSGKTTFLNCISTIDSPTGGTITVDGTDLTKLRGKALSKFRRERLGFIFQDCNLLDTLTALENIALALTISGYEPRKVEKRAREAARLLEVEEVLDKYPYQMSGASSKGWPPPGPWSPTRLSFWPTSPPGPWIPSRQACSSGSWTR